MADRNWQLEISGEVTKQRRIEAVDKLLSVLTLIVAAVFGLQAIGLDGACQQEPDLTGLCRAADKLCTSCTIQDVAHQPCSWAFCPGTAMHQP